MSLSLGETSMSISIVTVAYNSGQTISKTIESVLNQTLLPFEYIIVDGASKDDTVLVAEKYRDEFEKRGVIYRIISEPDHGIYDAMNKGIANSKGDIVGMINSNDWYEKNALSVVAQTFLKEPFDLFYADLRIIKPSGNFIKKAKLDRFPTTRHWNHPTTFVKRTVYNQIQYRLDSVYDDWDLILRLRKNNCKITVCNQVLANFTFGGESNEKNVKKAWKRFKDRYMIYRRNGYSRIYIIECALMETVKFILA